MKAKFILPSFNEDYDINYQLLNYAKKIPDFFQPNVEVYGFFGCFNGAIWNGGRYLSPNKQSKSFIQQTITTYNKLLKIPLRFTFTNHLISTKEQLEDDYCNMIVSLANNGMNEILVASDILEEYLRKNYPKFKYCKSIVAADFNVKIEDLKKYYYTVLHKNYSNDFKKLNTIPIELRNKVEILCNDTCIKEKCPYQQAHYNYQDRATLGEKVSCETIFCQYREGHSIFEYYDELFKNKEYISPNSVQNNYIPMGFEHFKLSGRDTYAREYRYTNWLKYIINHKYQEPVFSLFLERDRRCINQEPMVGQI